MLFWNDLRAVERAMDGQSARFQAAAANVANVHTPGYHRQYVEFEESLQQALAMSEVDIDPERDGPPPDTASYLDDWTPARLAEERLAQRIDGNGVSLEHEMGVATRSALKFNLLATSVASDYRTLKFIIDAR